VARADRGVGFRFESLDSRNRTKTGFAEDLRFLKRVRRGAAPFFQFADANGARDSWQPDHHSGPKARHDPSVGHRPMTRIVFCDSANGAVHERES
jgi:hypothetical protein